MANCNPLSYPLHSLMPLQYSTASSINDILVCYLDRSCITYLNDILIYLDAFEEHQEYVVQVLEAFAKASLHLELEMFEFHHREVKYLGLIISTEGIKMDPEKILFIYLFYLFLILACNRKVMVEATYFNYIAEFPAVTLGSHCDAPQSGLLV
jgi:hypothetical protein